MKRHLFYGDLNCPFCFAQNERLTSLGLQHLVEWRGVEHMPQLRSPGVVDAAESKILRDEVTRLRERAPGLEVKIPTLRSSSRLATAYIAATTNEDSKIRMRTVFYRALWQEDRDIGDPRVAAAIAKSCGYVGPFPSQSIVDEWTREWDTGGLDRRLPSLVSPFEKKLLGLATLDEVRAFLWTGREVESGVACLPRDED